ncbi:MULTISPECIES: acyltransferase [unclassified Pseudomonas]|uniref:acyltransferase family protein n=1 Tax=unclassified Pseudomonas TaxID=196821 RepID=UPI00200EAD23|nr:MULTISPECIES: acyltransferase [unclassified Pseudomonas]
MGAFRLLLAMLVAISHMGISIAGHNPGVFAVISFLIISGLVMTSLIKKNYSTIDRVPAFYLDRALRLYPQFLFYFLLACIIIGTMLPNSPTAEGISAANIIPSLGILPLDLYMFGITSTDIIPPAWSLGLEAFFYLAIPFILIWKLRTFMFTASLMIAITAITGVINTDIYGYRLLPGVLFIFLCGSYIFFSEKWGKILIFTAWTVQLILFIAIQVGTVKEAPSNTEVTAGIIFGIPAIYFLSKFGYHKIDEFFGNISYGVFLNHFIFIYIFHSFGASNLYNSPSLATALLACSFIASLASYYFIEKPILRYRHILRKKSRPNL